MEPWLFTLQYMLHLCLHLICVRFYHTTVINIFIGRVKKKTLWSRKKGEQKNLHKKKFKKRRETHWKENSHLGLDPNAEPRNSTGLSSSQFNNKIKHDKTFGTIDNLKQNRCTISKKQKRCIRRTLSQNTSSGLCQTTNWLIAQHLPTGAGGLGVSGSSTWQVMVWHASRLTMNCDYKIYC